jgi:hypothetical protein
MRTNPIAASAALQMEQGVTLLLCTNQTFQLCAYMVVFA